VPSERTAGVKVVAVLSWPLFARNGTPVVRVLRLLTEEDERVEEMLRERNSTWPLAEAEKR
jgi:hypothetical protein